MNEKLALSAALLSQRAKARPQSAELKALCLHQEVLETLVSRTKAPKGGFDVGGLVSTVLKTGVAVAKSVASRKAAKAKAPKAPKSVSKKSPATSTPAPEKAL